MADVAAIAIVFVLLVLREVGDKRYKGRRGFRVVWCLMFG